MGHTTVRISDSTRQVLREIAKTEGRSMRDLLEEAVETLRRKRFLEQANAAYASVRGDAKAWAAVEDERRSWDATLLDGLVVHEAPARYETTTKRTKRRKRT
jgi:predicted transcriptional regulator